MAHDDETTTGRWTGKPALAHAIKLVAWLTPIVVSIVATHLLARLVPRPAGTAPAVAWFIAMAIIATSVLYLVDKVARRLLPLAALFQLSLVFPDRAPSRFKTALRTRTVNQLEQQIAEIRSSGLSNDPTIAAETLIELVADLSAHDRLTRGHAERVRAYSQMIGEELKLKDADVEMLQWAGLLHDVGKLFVPDEILNKAGRLTDEEFDIIKKHPGWGAELCEPLRGWLGEWVDAVGQHHERWDGKGYPAGLAGTDIALSARIVAVADVFDVITSVRSYKAAGGAQDARKELAACAGTQFDEKIVRAFLNVSLGKLRLAMGPLSWLAQLPVVGRASLLPVAGTAASAAFTVGGLVAGGSFDTTHEYQPARVEAAAPATTVELSLPPLVTTTTPDVPETPVAEPSELVPSSTALPVTTLLTIETTLPPRITLPPPSPTTTAPPVSTTTTTTSPPTTTTTTTTAPPDTTTTTTTTPPGTTTTTTTTPPPDTTTTMVPAPNANDDFASLAEGDSADLDIGLNDNDVESARMLTAPEHGDVTQLSATIFRYQPVDDWYGVDFFTYEATGLSGATASAKVTVTVNNEPDAPRAADDVATVSEYGTVTIDAIANDSDADGDTLAISAVSSPAGDATTDGKSIEYSPTGEAAGEHTISYSVSDATGLSDEATIRVTVNPANLAPVLDPPGSQQVDEGATFSFTATATDEDRPADSLMFSMEDGDDPVPSAATIDPATGQINWTTTDADGGTTHEFRIVVTDDGSPALSDEENLVITVGEINEPPVLAAIGNHTVDESTLLAFTVTATDPDLPTNNITLTTSSLPTGATFNPTTGAFAWNPTEAQGPNTYDITFTATDNGTPALTDTETITITVTETNQPPVLAAIGNQNTEELNAIAFTVTATDLDLPTNNITLTTSSLPTGATFNPTTGAFAWTPTEAQGPNTYDITFTATDNGTPALTDTETITITVTETNQAPVLSDPGDQVHVVGQSVSLSLVASDPDVPANTLTFAAPGLPSGLNINPATGVISGTPTTVGSGSVTITVTETDGVPTNLSDSESFNWSVSNPTILISEIATSGAGGSSDEFIELYNPTSGSIAVDGWKLLVSDGDENAIFTITIPGGTTIGANEYFLVAQTSAAGPLGADLAYSNNMPKGAGVSLVTDLDIAVDAVGTATSPWKDGAGSLYGEGTFLPPLDGNFEQSYERFSGVGNCVDTDDNAADFFHNMTSRNPQASGTFEACGTPPPFVPPPPPDHVVISEFRFDGATFGLLGGGSNEFVEIYNPTPAPIDISGYRLYSQSGSLQAIVPSSTMLPSGSHLLFASASFAIVDGIAPDVWSAGGITNGSGVYLEDSGGGVVDAVSTGGTAFLEGPFLPPISGRVIHSYERLVGSGGGNCVDTDNNEADFFHNLGSQNPQKLSDPAVACAI